MGTAAPATILTIPFVRTELGLGDRDVFCAYESSSDANAFWHVLLGGIPRKSRWPSEDGSGPQRQRTDAR